MIPPGHYCSLSEVVRERFHLKNVLVVQEDFASDLHLSLLLGRIPKRPVLKSGFIAIPSKS